MSKTITRKYIKRITKREGNTSIRQSGGGSGGGGGASQYWVEDNYVSKLFFNRLFTVLDEDGNPIEPNDTETVIESIQSMFGFWTNAYLSALGQNPEGGEVALTLASLADVDVSTVQNGDALVWNAALRKWVPGSSGIDLTAMWAALATNGNQQIDSSHLATALTGYATETWVGNQGYITGSALNGYATESWVGSQISDMATQTWVSGNYLSQTDAAATYLTQTNAASTYLTKSDAATTYVSIAFFERLFKAYNGSTVIHPNNTTSTIDNIKAMFGFWTDFYLSALGNGTGGSTPGVTMEQVWNALGNSTTEQINISHLTTALSGYVTATDLVTQLSSYNPTNNFKTVNGNSIIGTGDINVGGGSGNYLPLTGGTLSRATTTNADSILKIINTATHIAPRGIEIFTPNNSAFSTPLLMGKAYGYNNMCDIDFIYADSGSTENAMSFGFYKNDNLIYLKANGNVGIGTTSPTQKLKVNGNVLASSFIKSGGTSSQFLKADGSVDSNTYATTSSLGNYVPLNGGTMSGTLSFTTYPCIRYIDGTTAKMQLGYYPTGGYSYFSNETNRYELRIYDNGALKYAKWDDSSKLYDVYHSGNFSPDDYVTLNTAQTITGVKTFSPTISSRNDSVLYLNNTYSGAYARGIDITFANQPASYFNTTFLFGKSDARNNKGTINFGYVDNQSNSNYVGIGFYANDNILNVTGGGLVGIGTTSPAYKLDVNGDVRATNFRGALVGNADSTTKLETSRTIWGQSFNGTGNVDGTLLITRSGFGGYGEGIRIVGASNEWCAIFLGTENSLTGVQSSQWTVSKTNVDTFVIYRGAQDASTNFFTISNTGAFTLRGTLSVTSNSSIGGTLGVTGATTLSSTLGVSGATTMSGKLTMNKSNIELVNTSSNNGIWVELKGVSYDWGLATGSGDVNRGIIDFGGSGWMLYFDASNTYCEYGNFICSGGVTALSDVRHKRIVSNTDITIEQIARMRSVKFLWSDGRNDDAIHVGSIAQDWQSILPEVVIRKDDKDGTLSLNYGVAALVSVITTARKVVDHERRIKELEKENERLRFEVEQLKIA